MTEVEQFFHAIRSKNTEIVEALLPLYLHSRSHDGSTALLTAAHSCCSEYIEMFIANGANVNDVDSSGMSCLMVACEKNLDEIVQLLFDSGANVNLRSNTNLSAFKLACMHGNIGICEFLLDTDRLVRSTLEEDAASSLILAGKMGNLNSIQFIINQELANCNVSDKHGDTSLIWASQNGFLDIVKFLISRGANINTRNFNDWTAFKCACMEGHYEIAAFLLDTNNLQKDKLEADAGTALIFASKNGHMNIIKLILERDIPLTKVDFQDENGDTAAIWSSQNGHFDLLKMLIKHGANVHIPSKRLWNSLLCSVWSGHIVIANYLLTECDVDINATTKDGDTALIWASQQGHYDICKLLIEMKCDHSICSVKGWNALLCATWKGHINIVQLLLGIANIDLNVRTQQDETALVRACMGNHFDIAKLLVYHGASIHIGGNVIHEGIYGIELDETSARLSNEEKTVCINTLKHMALLYDNYSRRRNFLQVIVSNRYKPRMNEVQIIDENNRDRVLINTGLIRIIFSYL